MCPNSTRDGRLVSGVALGSNLNSLVAQVSGCSYMMRLVMTFPPVDLNSPLHRSDFTFTPDEEIPVYPQVRGYIAFWRSSLLTSMRIV